MGKQENTKKQITQVQAEYFTDQISYSAKKSAKPIYSSKNSPKPSNPPQKKNKK